MAMTDGQTDRQTKFTLRSLEMGQLTLAPIIKSKTPFSKQYLRLVIKLITKTKCTFSLKMEIRTKIRL